MWKQRRKRTTTRRAARLRRKLRKSNSPNQQHQAFSSSFSSSSPSSSSSSPSSTPPPRSSSSSPIPSGNINVDGCYFPSLLSSMGILLEYCFENSMGDVDGVVLCQGVTVSECSEDIPSAILVEASTAKTTIRIQDDHSTSSSSSSDSPTASTTPASTVIVKRKNGSDAVALHPPPCLTPEPQQQQQQQQQQQHDCCHADPTITPSLRGSKLVVDTTKTRGKVWINDRYFDEYACCLDTIPESDVVVVGHDHYHHDDNSILTLD